MSLLSKLHIIHCKLHAPQIILDTAHCTLNNRHCKQHTLNYTLLTAHCTLLTTHCTLPTSMYSLPWPLSENCFQQVSPGRPWGCPLAGTKVSSLFMLSIYFKFIITCLESDQVHIGEKLTPISVHLKSKHSHAPADRLKIM